MYDGEGLKWEPSNIVHDSVVFTGKGLRLTQNRHAKSRLVYKKYCAFMHTPGSVLQRSDLFFIGQSRDHLFDHSKVGALYTRIVPLLTS